MLHAEFSLLLRPENSHKDSINMKTISTLSLTALLSFCCMAANAQSWTPGSAPHKKSKYYNGYGMDYSYGKKTYNYNRKGYESESYGHHPSFRDVRPRTSCPVGLQVGFVTKRYTTTFGPDDRFRENLWGEEGRFMNGIQMGLTVQPTSYYGVGFRTGFLYELYFANGNAVRDLGYNRFTEHDLYIPLDIAYNFSVANSADINLYTGVGLNTTLAGVYRSWGRHGRTDYQRYGDYDYPDRVNAMWEIGADVRIDHFRLGMTYGLGLNDQGFYDDARTRQNKFTLSAAVVF